ncbi:DUF402 domain-containing protein [Kibdelosporangium aridum]|uniref:DUF402 domain-containing protein n=1 Tax=Kibdelosporangium aridum TaxID=2030 RepID=UPI0035E654D7
MGDLTPMSSARPVPVLVTHRMSPNAPRPAFRIDNLVFSDEPNHHHHTGPRRYFWLLDVGTQLVYEPFGWTGEWYVDLVGITSKRDVGTENLVITDMYLDIIVEGMGPGYRIIDLDEFGTATRTGAISVETAADVMTRAQRFLDTYLHRGKVFPPAHVSPWFSADHDYPGVG